MRKISLFLFGMLICFFELYGQNDSSYVRPDSSYVRPEKEKSRPEKGGAEDNDAVTPWEDKLFVGVYPGFQISSYSSALEFSPIVGYKLLPKLYTGVGGVYRYYSQRINGFPWRSHIYGARGFAFFDVYKGVLAYGEFEGINYDYLDVSAPTMRRWTTSVKVGAGYKSLIGERAFINVLLLYNLSYDEFTSISASPFEYRFGVVFFPFRSKRY